MKRLAIEWDQRALKNAIASLREALKCSKAGWPMPFDKQLDNAEHFIQEAREDKLRWVNNVEDQAQEERTKHCPTCKGKGWIHTFFREFPKEGSDQCPDCTNQRRKE